MKLQNIFKKAPNPVSTEEVEQEQVLNEQQVQQPVLDATAESTQDVELATTQDMTLEVATSPVTEKIPFSRKYKKEITAYSLISIPVIWWCVFFVIPLFWALSMSFTDMQGGYTWNFVRNISFKNYANIFTVGSTQAEAFWGSLLTTGIWTVVMTIGNNILGIVCAFLISRMERGGKVFLALLFWPSLVSAVVGSDLTKTLFASDNSGLINQIAIACGGGATMWLDDSSYALFALMVVPFFFGFSTKMLIYYTSIISVPKTYLEAAELETTSKFTIFLKITLPLVKNTITLNCLLSIVEGFKVLGPMQLVTNGNANTQSAMLLIYKSMFEAPSSVGQGCAYAFVLFVIIMIFSVVQKIVSGKEVKDYD